MTCLLLIFENKTLFSMKNQWELIRGPNKLSYRSIYHSYVFAWFVNLCPYSSDFIVPPLIYFNFYRVLISLLFYSLWVFLTSVNWWYFTGALLASIHFRSLGIFSVFWLISTRPVVWVVSIYYHYITPWQFFTPVLAESLPLESEWAQIITRL